MSATKIHSIAIVGATGLVGTTLINLLKEKQNLFSKIFCVASQQSVGKTIGFNEQQLPIYDLAAFDFSQTQLAFFCIGEELAAQYVPLATEAGNIVIDKSYIFRNHPDVPLLVPEVNLAALKEARKLNIIANPNCNTIPLAVALKPIYDAVGISRINVSTYQSVSGTGKDAVLELTKQATQVLAQQPIHPEVYSKQIAFNVLPQISDFQENGYTREEMKVVWELQKIFNDQTIAINPTAVRVPVYYGHSAAVHLETKEKLTIKQAIDLLNQAKGIKLMDGHTYPTPAEEASGSDLVYVGRLREDISHPQGLNLWVVADNLRKGAALNALQIAEHIVHHGL